MFKRGDIANNLFLICFTHMECILCGWGRIGYSDVSIHAPARGATKFQAGMFYASVVSIHAPTRGGTIADCTGTENVVVSIHAPTRGATPSASAVASDVSGFNPRTHTGCDCSGRVHHAAPSGFNPRTHTNKMIEIVWIQPHGRKQILFRNAELW